MVGDSRVTRNHQTGQAMPNKLDDLTEEPLEEDRVITRGLMICSGKTLSRVYENEPDIYTVDDLKVRFR